MIPENVPRLANGQIQDLSNGIALEAHPQGSLVESFSSAGLARNIHVSQEVQFQGYSKSS